MVARPAERLLITSLLAALASLAGCNLSWPGQTSAQSTSAPTRHSSPAPTMQHATTTTVNGRAYNPLNPFAAPSQRTPSPYSSEVFPAGYDGFAGRPGVSSSPQFSLFGELPVEHGSGSRHRMANDATENLRQNSFATEGADFDPAVSHDGGRIYFSSTRHRPTSDIYYKSIDGRSVTQLTSDPAHDIMPAESPDGQRIAFSSNRNGSWDIYVMNAFGGQAVQITSATGQELHPTWSPDGQTLAYCRLSESSDRWELWTVDVSQTAVNHFIGYGLFPVWHPSENRILFQRSRDRGDRFFAIWTIDYVNGEGVAPTEIVSSPVAAAINPSWSPDGTRIAFSTVFNPHALSSSKKPETADVWIMNADGTGRANLTGGWHVNLMPTWSPEGRVYFVSNRNATDNIWSIGPEQAMVAAGDARAEDSTYAEFFPGSMPGSTAPSTATVPVPDDLD